MIYFERLMTYDDRQILPLFANCSVPFWAANIVGAHLELVGLAHVYKERFFISAKTLNFLNLIFSCNKPKT